MKMNVVVLRWLRGCQVEPTQNKFHSNVELHVNINQPNTRRETMKSNKWNEIKRRRERERKKIDQIKKFSNRCWFAVIGVCLCPYPLFSEHLTYACGYTKTNKCIPHRISIVTVTIVEKNAGTNQISVFHLFLRHDLFFGRRERGRESYIDYSFE